MKYWSTSGRRTWKIHDKLISRKLTKAPPLVPLKSSFLVSKEPLNIGPGISRKLYLVHGSFQHIFLSYIPQTRGLRNMGMEMATDEGSQEICIWLSQHFQENPGYICV